MFAAADKLSDMGPKRVFLSTGRRELEAFAPLAEHWFLLRMIDPPSAPLPLMRHELVLGRGPFSEAAERALLKRHGIEVLISKNSGGGATVAKLAAARALGLPAVMIARPAAPAGDSAKTPEAALGWILSQIG